MRKVSRIVPIRPTTSQPERATLPQGVIYALFVCRLAADGFPTGGWLAVLLPSLKVVRLNVEGYQPPWRLVAALATATPAIESDLADMLAAPHKVMSADRQTFDRR